MPRTEDDLPPHLFQCKGVWEEKCGVTLGGLKSNLSLSPSPQVSSKSTDRCFLKLLLRMREGREQGRLFFRLSLPPCTTSRGVSTAVTPLELGHSAGTGNTEPHSLGGLGDTWDPSSTQANATRLDEPPSGELGMVSEDSLASPSVPGHSLAASFPPAGTCCSSLPFIFNALVQKRRRSTLHCCSGGRQEQKQIPPLLQLILRQ